MDIFHYEFMRQAFYAGGVIAVLSAVLGYFVVLRNLGFASHALGHMSFSGAAAALLLGVSPMWGQLWLTLPSALLMGLLGDRLLKNDKMIGVVLAFSLGLGSLFLFLNQGYTGQASSILFGNLLAVSGKSLNVMLCLTFVSLLILGGIARPLLFSSLEPELAEANGIPTRFLSIVLMGLLAVGVTLASQAVGVLLIFTLLIGPAAIAMQWTKRFWTGIGLCLLTSIFLISASLFLSYYTSWPLSFWMSALVFFLYLIRWRS